jgi:nucleotide-binding universal stress UspA family protein
MKKVVDLAARNGLESHLGRRRRMDARLESIVVGIGLLERPDPVLQVARSLAAETGARLHAVHAYDPPAPLDVAYQRLCGSRDTDPWRHAARISRRLESHVREYTDSNRTVCHVVKGAPGDALAGRANELNAGLLVVGATRQDRVQRHYVGATAQGVVASAEMPVLIVRQPVVRPLRRVLLTSNLSDQSRSVCRCGSNVLRTLFPGDSPQVRCLVAVRQDRGIPDWQRYYELAGRTLEYHLRELPSVQPRIRTGEPADAIVDEANDWRADLLVLGNRGGTGHVRGIGNVAGMVLREVARNVLVIPGCAVGADRTAPETAGVEAGTERANPVLGREVAFPASPRASRLLPADEYMEPEVL